MATLSTIQAKIRYLLGELTSSTYSDTDINRAINNYYQKAVALAMEKMGKWDVNGEIATTNLVASQQDYSLPTDLLYLSRVEANFSNGTYTWDKIESIDERQYSPALSNNSINGSSDWFLLTDNSIFFQNPVETSVTNGLKIWYTSEVTALSGGTDTVTIPEHVTDYLVYGACLEYAIRTNDNEGYQKYTNLINENAYAIQKYYAKRLPETRVRLQVRTEHYE
jgi:hypothetical protein